MGIRLAALVVALAVLSGCGSVDEQEAGETGAVDATGELLPAPPIEAIDEPAPEGALDLVSATSQADDWISDGGSGCVPAAYGPEGAAPASEQPCPEDVVALILADEAKSLPADDPGARAVARLRLEDGGAIYVVEYESRGRGTCSFAYAEDGGGLPSGGATGAMPCTAGGEQFCTEICVVPVLEAAGGDRVVLAGTVPASAESIRITFADGFAAHYPLTGPALSTDSDQRIFIVEQSHGRESKLELLRHGEVVASEVPVPAADYGEVLPPDLTQTPGTEIELEGRMLTVEIGPDAPPEAQGLLEEERLLFLCAGSEDDFDSAEPPASSTHGRFPPGERAVTVELEAEVDGTLVMCGAGLIDSQEDGVFRLFMSYEELEKLTPGSVYQQDTDALFTLDGRKLTVAIGPDAAPETELLLERDLRFACGTEDDFGPYAPSAVAEGRFPPGKREVTVTLSADPGKDVFFCGVEAKDGSTEAFSFDVAGAG